MSIKLFALVTVDRDEVVAEDFHRLLVTGQNEIDNWIVVCRDHNATTEKFARNKFELFGMLPSVVLVTTPPCGVSEARNIGLEAYFSMTSVTELDILSFPDDDCSYFTGFGEMLRLEFASQKSEILIVPYAPSPDMIDRVRWPIRVDRPQPVDLLRIVSSAGIFITTKAARQIRHFDNELGVGTPRGSAEDIEFVLRAYRGGIDVRYCGSLAVIHDYRRPQNRRLLGNLSVIHSNIDVIPIASYIKAWVRALRVWFLSRDLYTACSSWSIVTTYQKIRLNGSVPRRVIRGLEIDVDPPSVLVQRAASFVMDGNHSKSVFAAHITALNRATDPAFRVAFNNAAVTMVDGISLSLIALLTPGPRLRKLATTDFAPRVFEAASSLLERPVRIAVVGGNDGLALRAATTLSQFSAVEPVFSTHGYWKDYSNVIEDLNEEEPDILLLGLGMPMEATWLYQHTHLLKVPLVITCGGWLRLLSGEESRAPKVMQTIHLEWFWRLVTDPQRTALRYFSGFLSVYNAIRDGWRT